MYKKIIISILLLVIISVIIFSFSQNDLIEKSQSSEMENNELSGISVIEKLDKMNNVHDEFDFEKSQSSEISEIEKMLNVIEEDKKNNDQSENPWVPKEREWIQSGPFMIDRSEYLLGEKIFINMVNLDENTKGKMIFVKSINMTHFFEYKKISFDGSVKTDGNLYLSINLNGIRGICTTDQLVGNWGIWFEGTDIQPLYFKIRDQFVPGQEKNYQPEC